MNLDKPTGKLFYLDSPVNSMMDLLNEIPLVPNSSDIYPYRDDISWNLLLSFKIITKEVLFEFRDEVDWEVVLKNVVLTKEEIQKYLDLGYINYEDTNLRMFQPYIKDFLSSNVEIPKRNYLAINYENTKKFNGFFGYTIENIKTNKNISNYFYTHEGLFKESPTILDLVDYNNSIVKKLFIPWSSLRKRFLVEYDKCELVKIVKLL